MPIDRLSGGVYRVKPASGLEAGEYCFFYAAVQCEWESCSTSASAAPDVQIRTRTSLPSGAARRSRRSLDMKPAEERSSGARPIAPARRRIEALIRIESAHERQLHGRAEFFAGDA